MSTSTCECGDHVHKRMTHWHVVLVSPEDAYLLQEYKCSAAPVRKPKRVDAHKPGPPKSRRRLHNLALLPPPGVVVDHANRNPLDNRRCNLRRATRSQNNANRVLPRGYTGLRGVHLGDRLGWYKAFITVNGKRKCLGVFKDKFEAAAAYDAAARRIHGEFAVTNDDLKQFDETGENFGGSW